MVSDPAVRLQPGDRVGRYVIGRVVGQGATGVVYAGFDPDLDRAVAIKLLHPRAGSSSRLLREAQAVARLAHRNVVTIHDVGVVDRQPFLAMELIEGETLERWLARAHPWREVLAVLRDAGLGLAAAHGAGIVHGDFKPDNVLITPSGRVVVTDFGLARRDGDLAGDTGGDDVRSPSFPMPLEATQEGGFEGTPAYAAPELHEGARSDALADQFSFCVALFEGLFGARPFQGDSVELLAEQTAAGAVTPVAGAAAVPRRLRRAVLRGLSPRPQDRWPSMHALLTALEPRRRAPLLLAAASTAALAGVVVFAAASGQPPRRSSYCAGVADRLGGVWNDETARRLEAEFSATGAPSAADAWAAVRERFDGFAQAWLSTTADACAAQERGDVPSAVIALRMGCLERQFERLEGLVGALADVDAEGVRRATDTVAHLPRPEVCIDDLQLGRGAAARATVEPAIQAELDAMVARTELLRDTAHYPESEALARTLLKRAHEVDDRWTVAEALLELAIIKQWRGEPDAEQAQHDALSAALAVEHHRVAAMAIIGVLELWEPDTVGGITRAQQWEQHCRAMLSAMGGAPTLEIQLRVAMGNIRLRMAHYDEAKLEFERAIELLPEGVDVVLVAGAEANLGSIEAAHGRFAEALAYFRNSRDHLERRYGPRHPNVAGASINVGSALGELGDLEGAHAEHLRALEIYEQNFGVDTPAAAPALRMLAWNGLVRLHHDEALGFAERALAIARRDAGDTESLARSLSMLSSIQLERGRTIEARAAADEALEIGTRALGEAHPMVAQLLLESGLVALQGGARDEARDKLTRSIALREREFGRVDAEVGRALTGLVELELLEHHGAAAIAMAREVRAIGQSPAIESENVRAEGAYLLARALRASGSRAERAEIPALVAEAREVYAASPEWGRRLAEIDAWAQQR